MESCIERWSEVTGLSPDTLKLVDTPSLNDSNFPDSDFTTPGALAGTDHKPAKIVMKILYGARVARFDILQPVVKLARFITQWTVACDKQLFRLMSYIKSTLDYLS